VLFTFPSQYWFTIGLSGVFSLARWFWQIQTGSHVSRLTQDTTRYSMHFVYGTITRYGPTFQKGSTTHTESTSWSYNPGCAETLPVWAVPLSLATTGGSLFVFFSSRYLDVSVPWVGTLFRIWSSPGWVSPFGNPRITGYYAPPRGLSQPIASFIASESQGIRRTPLVTFRSAQDRFARWTDCSVCSCLSNNMSKNGALGGPCPASFAYANFGQTQWRISESNR
jgi:hypothetical protein